MKLRHAAELALVVAFGCLMPGCTRHPPSSAWHLVEAPRRLCVGPPTPTTPFDPTKPIGPHNQFPWRDPGLRVDCLTGRTDQCFDTGAALSKWSRVSVGRWPFKRGDFDSEAACRSRVGALINAPHTLFGDVPPCLELMCIRADDPRLAK
jgi:hypothetical protein